MRDVAQGQVIHGHTLVARIGEGAYGEVWHAEYMGHPVALKLFNAGRRPANLRRELFAQYALGRLESGEARWFPRVDHIDLDAEPPYMRMELIEGAPLEERLANPALSLEERLAIGEKVLEALSVVHAHDFVHGDLSPRNVLVGGDGSVRLIDVGYGALFGEAADIEVSTRAEDAPSGVASPLYSAPERFKTASMEGFGKPSDIFSFGKLLYRLITGEQPFVIKPVSLKYRALGTKWDEFLFRCLEERPEARFADAAAALAEYRRINRVELAPGEYRAECAECGAAQSIPGGWAGERFACRRCAKTIEVLFYDDASRYATTAAVTSARPEPPAIQFLDREERPRPATPSAPPASAAATPAPPRSYVLPACLTFLAYALMWVPGAILNWYFLDEARRVRRETGRAPAGSAALLLMMWVLVYLPFLAVAAFTVLGLAAALLLALFA